LEVQVADDPRQLEVRGTRIYATGVEARTV
jgi:hypothetical protein